MDSQDFKRWLTYVLGLSAVFITIAVYVALVIPVNPTDPFPIWIMVIIIGILVVGFSSTLEFLNGIRRHNKSFKTSSPEELLDPFTLWLIRLFQKVRKK